MSREMNEMRELAGMKPLAEMKETSEQIMKAVDKALSKPGIDIKQSAFMVMDRIKRAGINKSHPDVYKRAQKVNKLATDLDEEIGQLLIGVAKIGIPEK